MSYLLFAATQPESDGKYVCETCNVLLEAKNTEEVYQAAETWAKERENESMRFVGIEELNYIQEDRPKHGDEIAGSYFDEQNIWSRVTEFILPKERLNAMRFEGEDSNTPVEDLLDETANKRLKRIFDVE